MSDPARLSLLTARRTRRFEDRLVSAVSQSVISFLSGPTDARTPSCVGLCAGITSRCLFRGNIWSVWWYEMWTGDCDVASAWWGYNILYQLHRDFVKLSLLKTPVTYFLANVEKTA